MTDIGSEGYAPAEDRPLFGYAALMSLFGALSTAAGLTAKRQGRSLPPSVSAGDVILIGVATHKLTRLIAKDKVTSFIRSPFTRFQESSGHGEVEEEARGHGLRKAIGELLICPYCLGQWVAAGFAFGLVFSPRLTRLLAGMWTAQAISDVAQLGYVALEDRV
jgi:hypothetical protein